MQINEKSLKRWTAAEASPAERLANGMPRPIPGKRLGRRLFILFRDWRVLKFGVKTKLIVYEFKAICKWILSSKRAQVDELDTLF